MSKIALLFGAVIVLLVVVAAAAAYSSSGITEKVSLPAGIVEGSVIRCNKTGAIYKIENSARRHYSTWDVYAKAGKPAYVNVDCAIVDSIPEGPIFV